MVTNIKIKVSCHWAKSKDITLRLLTQFGSLNKVDFVTDNSYDILVLFNYVNEVPIKGKKIILFANEPMWSGSNQKNTIEYENLVHYCTDSQNYLGWNLVESDSKCFYGGRGPWCDTLDVWSRKNLETATFTKSKNISSVVTTLNKNCGKNCLYPQRYSLVKNLLHSCDYVDFFGGWKTNKIYTNSQFKIDAVKDYKFNLSIENEKSKNWLTEKFYDCILTDTIPIHYGCENLEEIWPEGGYIKMESLDPLYVSSLLDYINRNSAHLYKSLIPKVRSMKRRYFEEMSLIKAIEREIKHG